MDRTAVTTLELGCVVYRGAATAFPLGDIPGKRSAPDHGPRTSFKPRAVRLGRRSKIVLANRSTATSTGSRSICFRGQAPSASVAAAAGRGTGRQTLALGSASTAPLPSEHAADVHMCWWDTAVEKGETRSGWNRGSREVRSSAPDHPTGQTAGAPHDALSSCATCMQTLRTLMIPHLSTKK